MFRRRLEEVNPDAQTRLREELRRLPVPETSPGFETRVHAALRQPEPGRLAAMWLNVRPALSAAAISLLVTLAVLKGMSMSAAPGPGAPHATVAYGSPSSVGAELRGELAAMGLP